ncbi:MAG: hypothetical protein Q9181_006557 [Wetmoreana brouardii]
MASYDDVGRIPRQAFVVSTTLLFVVCIISVCARYYIKIAVLKDFALDDVFLAFGTACLVAAMAVLYINMGDMYYTEALTYAPTLFASQPPDLNRVYEFRKLVTASLILTWIAMMAVKFSFLALFRRLIDRIPPLIKYWRVVVVFNVAVTGYGASVYVIACPHFSGAKVVSCLGGHTRHKTVQYALSQLVLDVFGDLLILYIPFQLIWKVKIKMIQKLTLACSLCLTVVVIIFTVTRASGLEWQDKLDVLWEVYFQIVAAEVGLILVALTAFRALFVSRAASKQHSPPKRPAYWVKSKLALRRLLGPRRWTTRYPTDMDGVRQHRDPEDGLDPQLPSIPGATMTGMQTFINHQGEMANAYNEPVTYPAPVGTDQDTVSPALGQSPKSLGHNAIPTSPQPERFCVVGQSAHTCFHCGQPVQDGTQ